MNERRKNVTQRLVIFVFVFNVYEISLLFFEGTWKENTFTYKSLPSYNSFKLSSTPTTSIHSLLESKKPGSLSFLCFWFLVLDTILQWMRVRSWNVYFYYVHARNSNISKEWSALSKPKHPLMFNLFTWTWESWCESIETTTKLCLVISNKNIIYCFAIKKKAHRK